jgi:hypothetical protein
MSTRVLILSAIGSAAVYANMLLMFYRQGWPPRLDMMLFWDEEDAHALLKQLGTKGRDDYVRMYTAPLGDLVFPFCYSTLLAALCWRSFSGRVAGRLVSACVAVCCLDVTENLCVLQLLREFPEWERHPLLVGALAVGPTATLGKYALLAVIALMLMWRWVKMLTGVGSSQAPSRAANPVQHFEDGADDAQASKARLRRRDGAGRASR